MRFGSRRPLGARLGFRGSAQFALGRFTLNDFVPVLASGGDVVSDVVISGRLLRVHQFLTVGTSAFVVSAAGTEGLVQFLLIGGGGGAGSDGFRGAGGGGAGGYISSVPEELSGRNTAVLSPLAVTAQSYTIAVGAGGSGTGAGGKGGSSTAFGNTATGGVGGTNNAGAGGIANDNVTGFNGGSGIFYNNPSASGGGGGGAGGAGGGAAGNRGGAGGLGLFSSITGTSVGRAGGGPGGAPGGNTPTNTDSYFLFGSGSPDYVPGHVSRNGTPNTGGGGSGQRGGAGGIGGSGVVIIRYPLEPS